MGDENPYAPPEAATRATPERNKVGGGDRAPRPWVDGDALVVHESARLPKRCIKCATKVDLTEIASPFEYVPPWARFAFGALGALMFRRSVTLHLSFCQSCHLVLEERRRAFRKVALGALALMLVPGVIFLMADREARGPIGLLAVVAFVAGLVLVVTRRKRDLDPYVMRSTMIKDQSVWLLGACAGYVERATREPKRRA